MARYSDSPEREAYYAGWLDGKKGQEPDYRAFCELKDKVSDAVTKQAQKLREAGEARKQPCPVCEGTGGRRGCSGCGKYLRKQEARTQPETGQREMPQDWYEEVLAERKAAAAHERRRIVALIEGLKKAYPPFRGGDCCDFGYVAGLNHCLTAIQEAGE